MFLCSFDACLCARWSDGHPVLKAVDRVFFKQCVWWWSEESVVFVETFGFEGKHPLCLSLESVKFAVPLGVGSDSMEVFIALQPQLDGAVNGDSYYFSAPSVGISFGGGVQQVELLPFQRNVAREEMLPSQLGLLQDCFAMGLGVFLDCDCVGIHPFGQAATNGVCQGFVSVHLLEAFSQLFDVSYSPFNP